MQDRKLVRTEFGAKSIPEEELDEDSARSSIDWPDVVWASFFVTVFGIVMLFDLRVLVVGSLQILQELLVR